jgi:NADH-quinone oxidoreductase subunit C/D
MSIATPNPAATTTVTRDIGRLQEAVPGAIVAAEPSGLVIAPDRLVEVGTFLRDDPALLYDYLSMVTSVDYPDRFELVYYLYSMVRHAGPIVLKVQADKADPVVPSLVAVWAGADLQEREVYDMMGIRFSGHPNLTRLLMWDGFVGFPLRKDYREPFFEEPAKPFASRWPEGKYVRAEERVPYHDNVQYPAGFDAQSYTPPPDIPSVPTSEMEGLKTQPLVVNLGPQHPSTHGVFRMRAVLDGERVLALEPIIGYMHRNHEKIGERTPYMGIIPYTDRLDYITSMTNNLAYVLTVEKLLGLKPPERAEYIRVIMSELTRLVNHFVLIGFLFNDLGTFFTPALYGLEERELILDLFEMAAGSRMMCNYMRFGGVAHDLPDGFVERARELVQDRLPKILDQFEVYLNSNEIFKMRSIGVGVLTPAAAINYSVTGPMLRASGVKYDIRRAEPYSIYDRFDFDIPVGTNGDVYDRYVVRLAEMRQSGRILEQALAQIPAGEIQAGKKAWLVRPPKGEAYARIEGPKGELGFYLVSDGSPTPYRYHIRPPSLVNLTPLGEMCKGYKVADTVVIFGSIDITLGEVDR